MIFKKKKYQELNQKMEQDAKEDEALLEEHKSAREDLLDAIRKTVKKAQVDGHDDGWMTLDNGSVKHD